MTQGYYGFAGDVAAPPRPNSGTECFGNTHDWTCEVGGCIDGSLGSDSQVELKEVISYYKTAQRRLSFEEVPSLLNSLKLIQEKRKPSKSRRNVRNHEHRAVEGLPRQSRRG